MTEKRFKLIGDSNLELLMQNQLELPIYDYDNNKKRLSLKNTLDLLNQLSEENDVLKQQLKTKYIVNKQYEELQRLKQENEQLKEALKNSYMNEICENCKYGNYFLSDNYYGGFEGDFECLKKHFGNDHWKCDGLTECDEFELEIKGDVE